MDKTDDITLKELLRTFSEYKSEILSRKKLIFITVLIFCLFALLLSKVTESKYQADITFVVQSPTSEGLNLYQILGILHHLLDLILVHRKVLLVKQMLWNCLNLEE